MKNKKHLVPAALFSLVLILGNTGCEIRGGNDTVRDVPLNITGAYVNTDGIPRRQSGRRITTFNLSQTGDQLFVIDNEGTRWTGSIGRVRDNSASVTLRGMTTDGNEVVITGNIRVEGTTANLTGTWVEPGFTSEISAEAGVAPQPQPTPAPSPTPGSPSTPPPGPTPVPTPIPGNSGTGGSITPPFVFPPVPG